MFSLSSCSSLEISHEENDMVLLNNRSSRILFNNKKKKFSQRLHIKRLKNDSVLETKLTKLKNENEILRAKIEMLRKKFDQQLFKSNEQSTFIDQSLIQITQI